MKLIIKIFISALLLITNYELLITNELSVPDNVKQITDNEISQLPAHNSQLIAQNDSIKTIDSEIDTLKPKPLDDFVSNTAISKKKYEMAKSPTTAVLLSLLLPGAGQFYNESYWKVPLFLSGTGVLTYLIIDNNIKYNDEQKKYDLMDDNDANRSRQKIVKEFYRDQRDQDAFYLLGVYILATVDAYVGAHLYDFNVSDDLTLKLRTDFKNGFRVGFSLNW